MFIASAGALEFLDWTDKSVEPGMDRGFGTGAISASVLEEAELYKRQVLYLIDRYFSDGEYTFIYKGKGAEFDKAD